MRPWKLALVLVLVSGQLTSAADVAAQTSQSRLEAVINDVRLIGSADIEPIVAGKSASERDAAIDAAVFRVKANQSFQVSVFLVTNGTRTNVTSSPNIVYEHDGCLTVSQSGFVTITPSRTCAGAKYPSLIVALTTDDKKTVIAANEYFFRVNE
jgi:hypothetical protein